MCRWRTTTTCTRACVCCSGDSEGQWCGCVSGLQACSLGLRSHHCHICVSLLCVAGPAAQQHTAHTRPCGSEHTHIQTHTDTAHKITSRYISTWRLTYKAHRVRCQRNVYCALSVRSNFCLAAHTHAHTHHQNSPFTFLRWKA